MRRIVQENGFMGAAICHDMIRGMLVYSVARLDGSWSSLLASVFTTGTETKKNANGGVLILDSTSYVATYIDYKDCVLLVPYMCLSTYLRSINSSAREVCLYPRMSCYLGRFVGMRMFVQLGFGCSFLVVAIHHRSSIYY